MSDAGLQRSIDMARISLCRGEVQAAMEWLDQLAETGSQCSDFQMLRGIALASRGERKASREALERAVCLAPHDARTRYNLACAMIETGDRQKGEALVEEALSIQPLYQEALHLKKSLETDSPRVLYDPGEPHTIRWIREAGKAWTIIGWALVGFSLLTTLLRWVHPVVLIDQTSKVQPLTLVNSPTAVLIVFLTVLSIVGSFGWVIFDLVDRRGRALWLVPMVVFSFWLIPVGAPQALYMGIGRSK